MIQSNGVATLHCYTDRSNTSSTQGRCLVQGLGIYGLSEWTEQRDCLSSNWISKLNCVAFINDYRNMCFLKYVLFNQRLFGLFLVGVLEDSLWFSFVAAYQQFVNFSIIPKPLRQRCVLLLLVCHATHSNCTSLWVIQFKVIDSWW